MEILKKYSFFYYFYYFITIKIYAIIDNQTSYVHMYRV